MDRSGELKRNEEGWSSLNALDPKPGTLIFPPPDILSYLEKESQGQIEAQGYIPMFGNIFKTSDSGVEKFLYFDENNCLVERLVRKGEETIEHRVYKYSSRSDTRDRQGFVLTVEYEKYLRNRGNSWYKLRYNYPYQFSFDYQKEEEMTNEDPTKRNVFVDFFVNTMKRKVGM